MLVMSFLFSFFTFGSEVLPYKNIMFLICLSVVLKVVTLGVLCFFLLLFTGDDLQVNRTGVKTQKRRLSMINNIIFMSIIFFMAVTFLHLKDNKIFVYTIGTMTLGFSILIYMVKMSHSYKLVPSFSSSVLEISSIDKLAAPNVASTYCIEPHIELNGVMTYKSATEDDQCVYDSPGLSPNVASGVSSSLSPNVVSQIDTSSFDNPSSVVPRQEDVMYKYRQYVENLFKEKNSIIKVKKKSEYFDCEIVEPKIMHLLTSKAMLSLPRCSQIIQLPRNPKFESKIALYRRVLYFMEHEKPYLQEKCSLETLSKSLYTNKVYLSKTINFFFGRNVRRFVCYYRIIYSMALMLFNPYIKIVHVSVLAGFHTPVTYNMVFKQLVGITPGEWNKLIEGENKTEAIDFIPYFDMFRHEDLSKLLE